MRTLLIQVQSPVSHLPVAADILCLVHGTDLTDMHHGPFGGDGLQDAAPEVASGAMRAPGLELELNGVQTCWLSEQTLLLALKDGQLWQVNLVLKGNLVDELKVHIAS